VAEGRPIGIWDRVVRAAILLAIPVIVIAASAAVWANHVHGTDGILAVVLAALVCLTGGCLSLAMLGLFQQTAPIQAILAGVLFRTVFPLFLGIALSQNVRLQAVGVFHYVMLFFGIVLVLETLLAVRIVNSVQPERAASNPSKVS
jgi:hypothetical protein